MTRNLEVQGNLGSGDLKRSNFPSNQQSRELIAQSPRGQKSKLKKKKTKKPNDQEQKLTPVASEFYCFLWLSMFIEVKYVHSLQSLVLVRKPFYV